MRHSFRFSGTGGQGLITAGIILAEAALLDDKLAVQSQSYGPEARGGSSKAEAIISDEPIYFSRVICPDTLLVMSQEAANKFIADCDEFMRKVAAVQNEARMHMDTLLKAAESLENQNKESAHED